MYSIGITGTREGFTEEQHITFVRVVSSFLVEKQIKPGKFHHGDCTGVDVQAAALFRELGWKIICHPPFKDSQRGMFNSDYYHPKKGYIERDKFIVDSISILFVGIHTKNIDSPRNGGTGATYSYAEKQNKDIIVVYPNDRIVVQTGKDVTYDTDQNRLEGI